MNLRRRPISLCNTPGSCLRTPSVFFMLAVAVLLTVAGHAGTIDLDYGIPLFEGEEIRLEKDKAPDFNMHLFAKYLTENAAKPAQHLHAISSFFGLIRLSDVPRARELGKLGRELFAGDRVNAPPKIKKLGQFYFEGLRLVTDIASDGTNVNDKAFEDLLIASEQEIADEPYYVLIKGLLLAQLRDRPNNYFKPFKPLEDLKRAAAMAPRDSQFQFILGQAFRFLGNREVNLFHAMVAYEKSGNLSPRNAKLHSTLLGIYMGLHESYQNQNKKEPFWLEEAVYKKILMMSPNNPYALNNLGYLYAEYGVHRAQAQELCQRAVDAMPNNPGFHDSLGWAAFKNGDMAKAETELKTAIQLNPRSFDPHYHLGTVYYVNKRFDEAAQAFEKALKINPQSAEALNNFAYMLAENNREADKARDLARRALAIDPNNPSYIDTLAWAEYRRGDLGTARALLEKANSLMPDVAEVQGHLAKIYQEQNQFDRALTLYQKAAANDPEQPGLRDEVFLTLNLRAAYQNLATYHRMFGPKASTDHLIAMLLQLSRLCQDVGQYSRAIKLTQLCEEIKTGHCDLAKPLLPGYTLPEADKAIASGTATATTPIATPAGAADETAFPAIVEMPLGLHVGPAVFAYVNSVIKAFSGFETLAISVFVPKVPWLHHELLIRLQSPKMAGKNAIPVIKHLLGSMHVIVDRPLPTLVGAEGENWSGFGCRVGQHRWWVLQDGDQLLFSRAVPPSAGDVRRMRQTFPWQERGLGGLLLDWERLVSELPRVVRWLAPNDMAGVNKFYSIWEAAEEDTVREQSWVESSADVTQDILKHLQTQLQNYQQQLENYGIDCEFDVGASGRDVYLQGRYLGFESLLNDAMRRLGLLAFAWRDRVHTALCLARRMLAERSFLTRQGLCPLGGETSLECQTGIVRCKTHGDYPVFPLVIKAEDRCALSRLRVQALYRRLKQALPDDQKTDPGRLLQTMLKEYNIESCPADGKYALDDKDRVTCTVHPLVTEP